MLRFITAACVLAAALLWNGERASADASPEAAANVCQAYTACWWGGTISCVTYGDACTWWVRPGVDVRCTGLNAAGVWVDLYFHC